MMPVADDHLGHLRDQGLCVTQQQEPNRFDRMSVWFARHLGTHAALFYRQLAR